MSNWWTRAFPTRPRTIRRRDRVRLNLQRLETRDTPSMSVGTNINITKSTTMQQENSIVINPNNPLNMFVSSTSGDTFKYTKDGGKTWKDSDLSAVQGGGPNLGDEQGAWDRFGNLFVTYFAGSNSNLVVALSTDGGQSFTQSLDAGASNNFDQPNIAVGAGEVWFDYTNGANRNARGAKVTGLGLVGVWTAAETPPGAGGNFGDVAVGPAGQAMAVYQESNTGANPAHIYVSLDPDGIGPKPYNAQIDLGLVNVGSFYPIPAQPDRTTDIEANLAWDKSNGPHRGRVYLVYTDAPAAGSADTDIFLRYSDDNGTTWSARKRINDDALGNGKSQFMPAIAIDQATGNVAITWLDCRNSATNDTTQVFGTVSFDGGVTFDPNVQISKGTNSGLVDPFNYGDYDKMDYVGGVFYRVWADNSNSTGDNPSGAGSTLDMYTCPVTTSSASGGTTFTVSPNPIYTGQTTTLTGSFTDPLSAFRGHTVSVDWGDGTIQDVNLLAAAKNFNIKHKYLDDINNAVIPIKVNITSPTGFNTSGTANVIVYNQPPSLVRITGAPTGQVNEGKAVTVGAQVVDTGILDTFTYDWEVQKLVGAVFTPFDSGTSSGFTFTPDDQGTYKVSLTVTDDDGASKAAAPVIIVAKNVAPTADRLTNDGPHAPGDPVTISFVNPTDSAVDVTEGLHYDFDLNHDGLFNAADGPGFDATSSSITLSSADSTTYFPTDGIYVVKARIRDQDGGVSSIFSTDVFISSIAGGNGGIVTKHYLAVASDTSPAGTVVPASVVRVYNTDGSVAYNNLQPFGKNYTAGYRVTTGDVNGDKIDDIIISGEGATFGNQIEIISGADGVTVLRDLTLTPANSGYPATLSGGVYLASADFNRDGFSDVVVGPASGVAPVVAFDGKQLSDPIGFPTPATLYSISPFGTAYSGGVTVAAGDVVSDPSDLFANVPDLIVGQATVGSKVQVYRYTGAVLVTPAAITIASAMPSNLTGGVFVAVGDLNGDGLTDIVVGSNAAAGADSRVRIFSGAAGHAMLRDFVPFTGYRGGARVAVQTSDEDGNAFLMIAPGKASSTMKTPRVLALRGTDLSGKFVLSLNDPVKDWAFLGGVNVG